MSDGRTGLSFWWVDVFATRAAVSGNRLMVFVPATSVWEDEAVCRRIAAEVAFSEVTFLVPDDGREDAGAYRCRIFTPAEELAFAGHPTLGSAVVWALETAPMVERLRLDQRSAGASVSVAVERRPGEIGHMAFMAAPEVAFAPPPEAAAVARALGVERSDLEPDGLGAAVAVGPTRQLLVPVRREALGAMSPDGRALAALSLGTGWTAVYAFSPPGADGRLEARGFAPALGIAEDPATGSAAAYLARYLAARGRLEVGGRLVVEQGRHVGRPSELHLARPGPDEVEVGGSVRAVARGHLLPDFLA